ncbi:MAG: hypothetical protein ACM3S5_03640 [Rhodospirillales bacterium]
MRLSGKALAISSVALWGGGVLAIGLLNLAKPKYGEKALEALGSVYPGTGRPNTLKRVLLRTAWASADGAAGGLLFARLYNCLAK